MNRRRSVSLGAAFATALLAALWWVASLLISAFAPQLVHSRLELLYGAFVLAIMAFAFLCGAWMGEVIPHHLPKLHHPHLHLHLRH